MCRSTIFFEGFEIIPTDTRHPTPPTPPTPYTLHPTPLPLSDRLLLTDRIA